MIQPDRFKKKTINGTAYTCQKLPAKPAMRIFRKIPKYLGEILGSAVDGGKEVNAAELVRRFGEILADDEFNRHVDTMLGFITVEQDPHPLSGDSEWWLDHMSDYYEVVAFAFEFNFGPAFEGALGKLGGAQGLKDLMSRIRPTSTPSSQASSLKGGAQER